MPLKVMLCCNDGRDGSYTGKASAIEIEGLEMVGGDVVVRFEQNRMLKGQKKYEGEHILRIGRRVFPCLGYQTWVGNWCWDCACVRSVHARQILNYLIERGWHCEGGPCSLSGLYDAIDAGEQISAELWKQAMTGDGRHA